MNSGVSALAATGSDVYAEGPFTMAGGVSAFLTETVQSVALLALGSAGVALLPIGGLAGRAVFQWSRMLWLGLGLTAS